MNQPQNPEQAPAAAAAPKQQPKKPTPVQEWDITASLGTEEILVGKAGWKIVPGPKKGGQKQKAVNINYLSEEKVNRMKNASRRLLRTYRAALRIQYGKDLQTLEDQLKEHEGELEELTNKKFPDSVFGWPQRGRIAQLREEIKVVTIEIGTIRAMMDTLEKVSPRIFDELNVDTNAANLLINS